MGNDKGGAGRISAGRMSFGGLNPNEVKLNRAAPREVVINGQTTIGQRVEDQLVVDEASAFPNGDMGNVVTVGSSRYAYRGMIRDYGGVAASRYSRVRGNDPANWLVVLNV